MTIPTFKKGDIVEIIKPEKCEIYEQCDKPCVKYKTGKITDVKKDFNLYFVRYYGLTGCWFLGSQLKKVDKL